ncbi:hypothetical protein EZJ19_15240 [Parasulfuritortus cantonensis]|uniref:Uncharacterized protein n=1 Tax=Parasulfuritortus cantonensis TaxID=2528202 RepID=A0A4R1B0X1_9PROT|nr:hypothetical protein [Parasulfuritortus cantonensis]TCJ11624.1 hypothetical protein EZJ19_15240 [Parasulfuritortus cantonensis]
MAADLYLASSYEALDAKRLPIELSLQSDGYYWFLYRYFESANIDRRHELIDLYGGAEISGYQLERLEDELHMALLDIQARPASWPVLVGWSSTTICRETEDKRVIEKGKLVALIENLLGLIKRAREEKLKLVYVGD